MANVWVTLNMRERSVLREVLATYRGAEGANPPEVAKLARKLANAVPHPDIAVGVYGGQVQWTSGNPFPIRIVDYDGDKEDLPSVDERGERCRMWLEPANVKREAQSRKSA